MAYYDALISKWATLTPGTTAAKLAQINAITVTGSVPTNFFITGPQLFNCIDKIEMQALTAAQRLEVTTLCNSPGPLLGGSANAGRGAPGLILAYFTNLGGPTITALTALAQTIVQPWWQATVAQGGGGLSSPVGTGDLIAAGGLT